MTMLTVLLVNPERGLLSTLCTEHWQELVLLSAKQNFANVNLQSTTTKNMARLAEFSVALKRLVVCCWTSAAA